MLGGSKCKCPPNFANPNLDSIQGIICDAGCSTQRPLMGCSKCGINETSTEFPSAEDTTIQSEDITTDRDFTADDATTSETTESTDDKTTMESTDETTNHTLSTESNTITTYQSTISPQPTEVTSDSNTNEYKDDTTTVIPTTAPTPMTTTTTKTTPTTTTTVIPTPDWKELCQELCRVGDGGKLCNCDLPPFF